MASSRMLISMRPIAGSFLPRICATTARSAGSLLSGKVSSRNPGFASSVIFCPRRHSLSRYGPGAHRIGHHPAARIGVGLDHLARDRGCRRGGERGQQVVVGAQQLDAYRVAIDRLQALERRVVVELAGLLGRGDRRRRADDGLVEDVGRRREHLRIQQALPRIHVIGGRQLALLPLERGVVGEIDAGLDLDRPGLAVGGDVGHRRRGVRHDRVGPRQIAVGIQRIEDDAVDLIRIQIVRSRRIEPRFADRKGDAQRLVEVGGNASSSRQPQRDCHGDRPAHGEAGNQSSFPMSPARLAGSAFGA